MTIKEIKSRIKSVQSIKKITRAMQMVSASKLRYILERFETSKKYISLVEALNSGESVKSETNSESTRSLLVLVSADRGLCGAHSSGIVKKYNTLPDSIKSNTHLVIVGSKAYDSLKKTSSRNIAIKAVNLFKKSFSFLELVALGNKINKLNTNEDYSSIKFFYNHYISSVNNEIREKEFNFFNGLGIDLDTVNPLQGAHNFFSFYSMSVLYSLLCHSKASEESIRMTSMDNATTSADELLSNLTRVYNMSRQASITTELIEIISGAESLNQGKN